MKFKLQLFAKKQSSTSTQSVGGSEQSTESATVGGSSTHKEGGSTTNTQGRSVTNTQSHSETRAHSEGGAHSEASGIQYAAGDVEDRTQSYRDQYNTNYVEGQKVTDTYNRLQAELDSKPGFQSTYESKLGELYDQIMNREKFSYNFNADPMYQMYKDQYTQQGKQAMEDTMGQASALTGGYGSSYGQSVGQQSYQNYLNELNNMIPELRNEAYQQYVNEGNELLNKYNVTSDAYNREYGQYRDQVADWQADRSFDYGMYSDERQFDYNQFASERDYWNQEYWNERNSAWANQQQEDQSNWNDSQSVTNAQSRSETNYAETSNTNYWEDSNTNYWENSSSHSTGTNWNNTTSNSMSFGGGNGSGGSSGSWSGLKDLNYTSRNDGYVRGTDFGNDKAVNRNQSSKLGQEYHIQGLEEDSPLNNSSFMNNIVNNAKNADDLDKFLEKAYKNGFKFNGYTYQLDAQDINHLLNMLAK